MSRYLKIQVAYHIEPVCISTSDNSSQTFLWGNTAAVIGVSLGRTVNQSASCFAGPDVRQMYAISELSEKWYKVLSSVTSDYMLIPTVSAPGAIPAGLSQHLPP